MTFRLNTKTLFLTYPQNSTTKEQALDNIKSTFNNNIEFAIVAKELHQDGNSHLHILIKLIKKIDIRNKKILDDLTEKSGNYQSARNIKDVIQYITKDDDYLTSKINVLKYLENSNKKQTQDAKGIWSSVAEDIETLTLNELSIKYKSLFIQHSKKIIDAYNHYQNQKHQIDIKTYYDNIYTSVEFKPFQQDILNIVDGDVDRRKVYWYYDNIGNTGKSYLTTYLELYKNAYVITGGKHTDMYRHYNNEKIIILDLPRDYDSNESIYSVIENFKNGYFLDTKYEGSRKRFIPPHVIVMANFKPILNKLSKDRLQLIDITPEINSITNQTNCSLTYSSEEDTDFDGYNQSTPIKLNTTYTYSTSNDIKTEVPTSISIEPKIPDIEPIKIPLKKQKLKLA